MASPEEVAAWMARTVRSEGRFYQVDAAEEIQRRFGGEHIYHNAGGAPALSRELLDAFGKLTAKDVVWIRGRRYWRKREPTDGLARIQNEQRTAGIKDQP